MTLNKVTFRKELWDAVNFPTQIFMSATVCSLYSTFRIYTYAIYTTYFFFSSLTVIVKMVFINITPSLRWLLDPQCHLSCLCIRTYSLPPNQQLANTTKTQQHILV